MEHGKGILKLCGLAVCVLPWHSVLGPCTPGFPSHCCWDIFSISGRYLQLLLLCFTYLLASMQGSRSQVLKSWCKGRLFPSESLPTDLSLHQPTTLSPGLLSILPGVKLLLRPYTPAYKLYSRIESSLPLLPLGICSCFRSSQAVLARGCSLGSELACIKPGLCHNHWWHGRFSPTAWSVFMQVKDDVMGISSLLDPELFRLW